MILDELLDYLNRALTRNREDRKKIKKEIADLRSDIVTLDHIADRIRARLQGIEEARSYRQADEGGHE